MEFQLEQWHWWVFSLGFVVCIAMSSNPIFIWLTAGTAVVGTVVWFNAATPLKVQLMLFSFIVITGYLVSLYFWSNKGSDNKSNEQREHEEPKSLDQNFLNKEQSEAQHIEIVGRTFMLEEPIVNGVGMLNFDGKQWRIRGADIESGNEIRIVSVDGIDQTLLEVMQVVPSAK